MSDVMSKDERALVEYLREHAICHLGEDCVEKTVDSVVAIVDRLARELEVAKTELAGGRKLALAFCLAGAGEDQDELDALVEFADPDGASGVAKLKGE